MFGICYYPEHWPQSQWQKDAEMMAELGLTFVRIGEFAWSRMEPREGQLQFEWLDQAVETLAAAGLKVVMCTPTATPPKWLVDKIPEMLPVDPQTGRTRGFGSRRHYDFSSDAYKDEAMRITLELAARYGKNEAVAGWQTDNELCCHDTTLSASPVARDAFQKWCSDQYGDIRTLNAAWGNVFWSMEYQQFSEIELPVGAVTETSPAHRLAYRRFSSAKVIDFHDRMVEIIRANAPGKFVTHNFIPMAHTDVDDFALARPLDFASYDNYPLGLSDIQFRDMPAEEFRKYMRTGHPDFATYDLDQTRGLSKSGFWVMEQQPGPVNWADNNPRPVQGMVRFWTLQAFAHGASCVSYFRWRQAPFAQEQMHAGLLRPDNSKARAWNEVDQAVAEIALLDIHNAPKQRSAVAMVTSPESMWVSAIERQSESYDFDNVQFTYYSALRSIGLDVDFVDTSVDLDAYDLVIAPGLPVIDSSFVDKCERSDTTVVFGPRSGAKTSEFGYPSSLPPGPLQKIAPLRVLSVETLRPDCVENLIWRQKEYDSLVWREEIEAPDADVLACYDDGTPAIVRYKQIVYIATLTCTDFLADFFRQLCEDLSIRTRNIDKDVRITRRGNLMFAFNYSDRQQELSLDSEARILLGSQTLMPYDITVWLQQDRD